MSDEWHVVQEDSVVGSSEEEETTSSSANLFKKLAKTCRQDTSTAKAQSKGVKKVAPGRIVMLLLGLVYCISFAARQNDRKHIRLVRNRTRQETETHFIQGRT